MTTSKIKVFKVNLRARITTLLLVCFFGSIFLTSCKKSWLDSKPSSSLVTPTSIADYQALLDHTLAGNGGPGFNDGQNALGEESADNYYVSTPNFNALGIMDQNIITWSSDTYGGGTNYGEWNTPYQRILYTNIILEGVNKLQIDASQIDAFNQVVGSSYFFRGFSHFQVADLFCKTYVPSSANTDLGIPLRLSSDVNIQSKRATVSETYSQILADLKSAVSLLPKTIPVNGSDTILYRTRPTKSAAYALLARVYLSMQNYDSALVYADKTLQLYSSLIDYNKLNASLTNPIPRFNSETIFLSKLNLYVPFLTSRLIVDSTLYAAYGPNDLRKSIYFTTVSGSITYKGSYDGSSTFFGGPATDEIYLIRAECNARKGNLTLALQDLNTLLSTRWKNGTFTQFSATTSDQALSLILTERRKELCFRGIRWTDLRRLNQESNYQKTLIRVVNGLTFTLPPNDDKYLMSIPPTVIQLSGMEQNVR